MRRDARPTTTTRIILAAALSAAVLGGCASTSDDGPRVWVGGDPARLAADKTACHHDTDNVDAGQANGYSDSRYGVATALAEAIDRDDPLKDHRGEARVAAFQTCMADKGWRPG